MSTSNLLCLLCGSLISGIFFWLLLLRQNRLDERILRHVRRAGYLEGWQQGRDSKFTQDHQD